MATGERPWTMVAKPGPRKPYAYHFHGTDTNPLSPVSAMFREVQGATRSIYGR